ncbi:MAG: PLDc N-terminal domain-containing protein [Sedimenticola sp.]|nr:PLDc N-terminal domain-containing protein [Sedimenticola sp.]
MFAIIKIAQSSESTGLKILWIVVVLILPLLGLILWFLLGPGDKRLKL